MIKLWKVLWAMPNTLLGCLIGFSSLPFGGRVQWRRGCLEFHDGPVSFLLKHMTIGSIVAMTLGHTILGISDQALRQVRDHEHVHVRQYERWGVFFLPAYLGSSLYLWIRGRDSYRENPFEIEAYSNSTYAS